MGGGVRGTDGRAPRKKGNRDEFFFSHFLYFTVLKGVRRRCGSHLPPVQVLLVEDLQDVSAAEAQARLLAGDQVVVRRVVIKVALHKSLKWKKRLQLRGGAAGCWQVQSSANHNTKAQKAQTHTPTQYHVMKPTLLVLRPLSAAGFQVSAFAPSQRVPTAADRAAA